MAGITSLGTGQSYQNQIIFTKKNRELNIFSIRIISKFGTLI
ncbi:MAG: hypothetical protein ACTSUT_17945 [Promethearchaeota archaeon]